ncbi:MAG: lysophospholipid acyltransferase family protein [Solirubrobacteraceae bacterium]
MGDREIDIPRMLPERGIDIVVTLLEPLERVTRPKLYGAENIPADGSLLVGNHTLYGLLDLPFMLAELWKRRHLTVRSLGERAHYAIPLWREALTLGGMVRGTRENVRALMDERQTVLVFPGGSREVNKRRGEKYQLIWKERIGFARLAIEYGYPIVPFAAVGAEEMLDIVIDESNPAFARLGDVVRKLTGWPMGPLVHGVGPTLLPHAERLYFWFGEPIDTTRFEGRQDDDEAARAVRNEVKRAVEGGIDFLLAEREADPRRPLRKRLLSRGTADDS